MKKKVLIADTSWLMEIGKNNDNLLVKLMSLFNGTIYFLIHNRVIKELDGLKNVKEKALQARRASRFIEEACKYYPDKIKVSSFGIKNPLSEFESGIKSNTDAIVLTLAYIAKAKISSKSKISSKVEVVLLTTDRNQRILAKSQGIKSYANIQTIDQKHNKENIQDKSKTIGWIKWLKIFVLMAIFLIGIPVFLIEVESQMFFFITFIILATAVSFGVYKVLSIILSVFDFDNKVPVTETDNLEEKETSPSISTDFSAEDIKKLKFSPFLIKPNTTDWRLKKKNLFKNENDIIDEDDTIIRYIEYDIL